MRFASLRGFVAMALATAMAVVGAPDGAQRGHAQIIPDVSGPWPVVSVVTATPLGQEARIGFVRLCVTEIEQTGGTLGGFIDCDGLGGAIQSGTISASGVFGSTNVFSRVDVTVNWTGTATSTFASGTPPSGGWSDSSGFSGAWAAARCGTADSDEDALLDCWESGGIDFDNDGLVDLDLAALGSNPGHKDLFVEIDYMDCAAGGCASGDAHSDAPLDQALSDVRNAFRNAPVANPDGLMGIDLHTLVDESLPHIDPLAWEDVPVPGPLNDFDDLKLGNPENPCGSADVDGHFGTRSDRVSPNCRNIVGAKRMVFRYSIFGHSIFPPGPSGLGEVGGNDTLNTLGQWTPAQLLSVGGRDDAQAGLFMHEFGHNLNLDHGGNHGGVPDDTNCKPNYLSVMSYTLAQKVFDPTRPLDYSRQELLTLNEEGLYERFGVLPVASGEFPLGRNVVYSSPVEPFTRVEPAFETRISWDGDEDDGEANIPADINNVPGARCDGAGLSVLRGANDWPNISYGFRQFGNFQDYAHTFPSDPDPSGEDFLNMARSVDYDSDGHSNADDNCPAHANPGQQDSDGDGEGDACERIGGTVELLVGGPEASMGHTGDSTSSAIPYAAMASGFAAAVVVVGAGGLYVRRRLLR